MMNKKSYDTKENERLAYELATHTSFDPQNMFRGNTLERHYYRILGDMNSLNVGRDAPCKVGKLKGILRFLTRGNRG